MLPLNLSVDITSPIDGSHNRWGPDEPSPNDVPNGLTFTTTMPGGFEQMSCNLARNPAIDYTDLNEFSKVTVYGVGGDVAWEGRLQATPRTSGTQMVIAPAAVGYQAALDDNQSARMIYIDCDMTHWGPASVQRQLIPIAAWDYDAPSVVSDASTGYPSIFTSMTGAWTRARFCEALYDAQGLSIGYLAVAWKIQPTVNPADTNWDWASILSSDDVQSAIDSSPNLRAAGPGIVGLAPTGTRKFAMLAFDYMTGPAGAQGTVYGMYWTMVAVFGTHGIPARGAYGYTAGGAGYYASDIINHAVTTWASTLATTRNGVSTIELTSFIIPQMAFLTPTTAGNIINAALLYHAEMDWWVDEGPTFNLASWQNHGRQWQARVGPSGLQETGPDVTNICNNVIVTYNDVTGAARTVGPTGSGANTIDDSLHSTDPSNPANAAGITRYPPTPLANIGTSTAAAAAAVGRRYLSEQNQKSTTGQATLVGYVQDNSGVMWPAWEVRSGDWITFVDAHDPVPRRIVKTSYSDSTKTNSISLDSPPEDLDAVLARMQSSIIGVV